MEQVLDYAKRILLPHCHAQGVYLDGTMGQGNDTLFFARHCPDSRVVAFDIQPQALEQTRALLEENGLSATLICDSHANLAAHLQEPIDAAIFNFGYLPNGDKQITTTAESSLQAVQAALTLLKQDGLLVLVCYPGHPQGALEAAAIDAYCRSLNGSLYHVVKYDFINKKHPPFVLAIEHRIPTLRQR